MKPTLGGSKMKGCKYMVGLKGFLLNSAFVEVGNIMTDLCSLNCRKI